MYAREVIARETAMPPTLKIAVPTSLRMAGINEKWLQNEIERDPMLLGLGELEIVSREHRQPSGGRIDFLMKNVEDDTFYEVELMLGAVDESHIIRTIEYWDLERQRRPKKEHRAVIVAEDITARFFNVLRLLNRAVPLIAIKLSAFQIGAEVYLHPVTVLDIMEEIGDDTLDPVERADRSFWALKSQSALDVLDFVVSGLEAAGVVPKVTYNRHHIAVGSTGNNFCWFHARKAPRCRISIRVSNEREVLLAQFQATDIDVVSRDTEGLGFTTTLSNVRQHEALILSAVTQAEADSR